MFHFRLDLRWTHNLHVERGILALQQKLTTCVRVMHVRRYVLTHKVYAMSFVCQAEKSEMTVCFLPLHNVEVHQ